MHLLKASSPFPKGEEKAKHLSSRDKCLASSVRKSSLCLTGGKEAESILKLCSRSRFQEIRDA